MLVLGQRGLHRPTQSLRGRLVPDTRRSRVPTEPCLLFQLNDPRSTTERRSGRERDSYLKDIPRSVAPGRTQEGYRVHRLKYTSESGPFGQRSRLRLCLVNFNLGHERRFSMSLMRMLVIPCGGSGPVVQSSLGPSSACSRMSGGLDVK